MAKVDNQIKTYIPFIAISSLSVCLFGLFQHHIVLKIPLPQIKFQMLFVPFTVGAIFGALFAKMRILKKKSDLQFALLKEKDQELHALNTRLGLRVEERSRKLIEAQSLNQKILDSTDNIVVLTDGKRTRIVNKAFFRFFGNFSNLNDFNDQHGCIGKFFEGSEDGQYIDQIIESQVWAKYISLHPDETYKAKITNGIESRIFDIKVRSLQIKEENLFVVSLSDVTQLVAYKNKLESLTEKLRYQLYYDELTGLPNRSKLMQDIRNCLGPGLMILDIDSFKEINNYFSHDVGDLILKGVAEQISSILDDKNERLYRLPGDEYAILFQTNINENELVSKIKTIIDCIIQHNYLIPGDTEIIINISAGVVAPNLVKRERLMNSADIALKSAIKQRKNYVIYKDSLMSRQLHKENLDIIKIVNEAIHNDRIIIYIMPIINNENKSIEKFECLARIANSDGSLLLPDKFIPASKTAKLYPKITRQVVLRACETFHNTNYEFSINISVTDILNRNTVEFIYDTIKKYKLHSNLILEILESEGMENLPEITNFFQRIKEFGCKIAIDDFGSGYSNFDQILRLNVDYLKIDSSLIKNMAKDNNSFLIVHSIHNFAKKLGISTVAEHVHDAEIQKMTEEIGLDFSQGFYLGKPEPADFYLKQ